MREKRGKRSFLRSHQGSIPIEFFFWLLVGIIVLVTLVFIVLSLSGKTTEGINFIKQLLFGG